MYRQALLAAALFTGAAEPSPSTGRIEGTVRDSAGVPVANAQVKPIMETAEAIAMEDTGGSTWESLSNFAEVADQEGWERALIVTDPFHSLRSRLIAEELGLTAYTSPTRTSPVQGREELMLDLKEGLGISLGRIIGFERLWEITG